jgi:hypothetical protein
MLFVSFAAENWTVLKLISWKHSFRKLSEEFEMAKKKKQALDNLLNSGRISMSTHELISKEIEEALIEIEKQQKALLEKMNTKMVELEGQIKTLEMLLADSEIRHVTGEVEEEVYQRESSLLSMGLETSRQELDLVKDAVTQLTQADVVVQEEMKSQEASKNEEEQKPAEAIVKGEEKQETQQ